MDTPFTIDRQSATTLTDQVANGLVQAIRCGHYAPGERLPSMLKLAQALDVSEIVVRRAIRQLEGQGEVVARRGSGVSVAANRRPPWRANVLYLSMSNTYFFTSLAQAMMDCCEADRIRLSTVYMTERERDRGLPNVFAVLDGQPVDLVVLGGELPDLESEIRSRHLPIIRLDRDDGGQRYIRTVSLSFVESIRQMAAHLHACGARRLGILMPYAGFGEAVGLDILAAAGIDSRIHAPSAPDMVSSPEAMEHNGWLVTTELLAAADRPDALYYPDDYVARGGLMALAGQGIDIPGELQLVIHANACHLPSFPLSPTRILTDPADYAATIVQAIQDALAQPDSVGGHSLCSTTFIPAETTRLAGPRQPGK